MMVVPGTIAFGEGNVAGVLCCEGAFAEARMPTVKTDAVSFFMVVTSSDLIGFSGAVPPPFAIDSGQNQYMFCIFYGSFMKNAAFGSTKIMSA